MIALDYQTKLRRKKARGENLILIKVHDYIDNYSGEITAFGARVMMRRAKINKLNFRTDRRDLASGLAWEVFST